MASWSGGVDRLLAACLNVPSVYNQKAPWRQSIKHGLEDVHPGSPNSEALLTGVNVSLLACVCIYSTCRPTVECFCGTSQLRCSSWTPCSDEGYRCCSALPSSRVRAVLDYTEAFIQAPICHPLSHLAEQKPGLPGYESVFASSARVLRS